MMMQAMRNSSIEAGARRPIRVVVVDDSALDLLGEAGFDPVYGARPLKRAIRAQLENPLAQGILAGKFGPGDGIDVGVEGGRLRFEKVLVGEVT